MQNPPKHILLERAHSYKPSKQEDTPQGCHYDLITGAWIIDGTTDLLVNSKERPRPVSKKNDIETGEDQKGQ
jgi:hypothetical protein